MDGRSGRGRLDVDRAERLAHRIDGEELDSDYDTPEAMRAIIPAVKLDVPRTYDIWVFDLASGSRARLSFEGVNNTPVWTPDGKSIVYGALAGERLGGRTHLAETGRRRCSQRAATNG